MLHLDPSSYATRLDRDVAMKRQLIEEQRTKIKSMESLAQNDEKATVRAIGNYHTNLKYTE